MRVCLILTLILPLVWTKVEQCANGKGALPKSIKITGCDNGDEECDFVRGKAVVADIEFIAQSEIKALVPYIYLTLGKDRGSTGVSEMLIDRYDGCSWLNEAFTCPIRKGNMAKWQLNFPIDATEVVDLPSAIEVLMRDQDNSTQFCVRIWGRVYPL